MARSLPGFKGRLRPALAAVPLLVALVLAWPGTPGASGAFGDPRLTVNITETDVDLGKPTAIKGRLLNIRDNAYQRVFLVARKFPYRHQRIIRSTYTATGGTYFFRVRPTLNTRYHVAYGGARSRQVRAFVYPVKQETTVETLTGNVARARFYSQFPRDYPLKLGGRLITWYFRKDDQTVYRKIATSRSKGSPSRRMKGTVRFDLPQSEERYSYFVTWCYALGQRGQDIGIGRNAGGPCPDRLRVAQ